MSMNGEPAANDLPPIPQLKNPIVQMLEEFLAQAKAGNLAACGIVAISQQRGVANAYVGMLHGDLYVGAGMLQARLLGEIVNPKPMSSIVRARP